MLISLASVAAVWLVIVGLLFLFGKKVAAREVAMFIPNLARLFADFVLSDEGQRLFAKGYAHPIRVVAGNLTLPADLNPKPITQLTGGKYVRDWNAASVLLRDVAKRWAQEVLAQ